ncbi:MAG: glycosyltransferase family 2 protein [Actinobacteria bacterium]|nr:MAG: glycosyltransferase family 2 protein [Actinomycetota bacterium]
MAKVSVQRIVFPTDFELPAASREIEPLYFKLAESAEDAIGDRPRVLGRTTIELTQGQTLNTDGYFNRLHAGYWARWTVLDAVEVAVTGTGRARVVIRRSTANAMETTVRVLEGELSETLSASVPLGPSAAGGCLWLEIEALDPVVVVTAAGYWGETNRELDLRTDIAVCTYNRPDDVLSLLKSFQRDEECAKVIDHVWIVDNGEQSFEELPGSQQVIQAFGDSLSHLFQPNLGGSGGFSRGLFEAAYHGDSPSVLLLDDDVVVEPEGLRRSVVFFHLAKRPVVVGGHMLNRAVPTELHSSAEWIDTKKMIWGPAPGGEEAVDLVTERQDEVLDAGFNAWWSCLIPTDAVRKVGLGMPFFIKYDDVEYGYRLLRAGFPTVTLPGFAVWHEPWTLKDDAIDWTNYFHTRNRLVFAALMSAGLPEQIQKKRVAAITQHIILRDILRNVLRRAYATASGAELAMIDFLRGPDALREPLQDTVSRVRAARMGYPDAETGVPNGGNGDRPTTIRRKAPKTKLGIPRAALREFGVPVPKIPLPLPPSMVNKIQADPWRIWERPSKSPEVAELPKNSDHYWGLADVPDAWVATVDGAKTSRRTRQPDLARELMKSGWATSKQVKERFSELCDLYAAEYAELTSPQTWAKQFGIEVDQ